MRYGIGIIIPTFFKSLTSVCNFPTDVGLLLVRGNVLRVSTVFPTIMILFPLVREPVCGLCQLSSMSI